MRIFSRIHQRWLYLWNEDPMLLWVFFLVGAVIAVALFILSAATSSGGDAERYMQRFDSNMQVCMAHDYSRDECVRIVSESMG